MKTNLFRVFLALGLGLMTTPSMASASPAELFQFVEGRDQVISKAAASSTQNIQLHRAALQSERLSMALSTGNVFEIVATDIEIMAHDHTVWRGRFSANEGRAVLTQKSGIVIGTFWTPEGFYTISPTARGHVLEKIEQDRFPSCQTEAHSAPLDLRSVPLKAPDLPSSIDLMSLYTPEASTGAGGTAQIEATIQHAVDLANTAFIDSDMVARFNLVHVGPIPYSDSGDASTDLDWLVDDAEVAALRDQWCADLVSLIVEDLNACGVAKGMRSPAASFESQAFQVTRRDCAAGNLTFAHEHGHNMGFEHNPQDGASPNDASYTWSFGHFVDGSYRTVMSYNSPCAAGCTRVAHFSNPQVNHSGAPTGTATRDNHRTGDLTADIVANFRERDLCEADLTSDIYQIRSVDKPWKCIDIQGASTSNGALAQIYNCHGGQNQRWRLTDNGGGRFRISALHSGRCLDVKGAHTNNGRNVQQFTCHGGSNQSWQVNQVGGGEVQFVAEHSDKCLEAKDAGLFGQQDILEQRSCGTNARQRWILDVVESCGDGICTSSESCANCSADCGSCSYCGDGTCNLNETCATCAADCQLCVTICGNGLCESAEECLNCPVDCGSGGIGLGCIMIQ